ncbi:nucleotidyltransferase domain-containing protein [Streptomyces alfalfae]|uniref:nucleotidyltransferase domain-containing protein n=1 Tax=Streptomyces alfalfae TaxID=1642299 RepID=UPI0039F71DCE
MEAHQVCRDGRAPDGREIDLHPLVFADDGAAVQASPPGATVTTWNSSAAFSGSPRTTPAGCCSTGGARPGRSR